MLRSGLIGLILILSAVAALADGRVALLIGNGDYTTDAYDLAKPERDVAALAEALTALDFQVITALNADRTAMLGALQTFEAAMRGAEIGLFHFAGHGVQIAGENHLIGTAFAPDQPLADGALALDEIRATFARAQPDLGLILLDACRDNPFAGLTAPPGLARPPASRGLLIAYATDPGNVAYEGDGETSPFTTALIDHLATPGLEARLLFGRVRQQVLVETQGRQVPWVEEAVIGEHFLAGRDTPPELQPIAAEVAVWRDATSEGTPGALRGYLSAYPSGLFAEFAADRIRLLTRPEGTGTPTPAPDLAGEDPARLRIALRTLGYEPATRTLGALISADLTNAFAAWRADRTDPTNASVEMLYADAAHMTVFLAATTAQRLRTDIVALAAIDRTRRIALDAYFQLQALVDDHPEAATVLAQAEADLQAIAEAETRVLLRLDEGRTAYQDLLDRARAHFPDLVGRGGLLDRPQARGLDGAAAQNVGRDATLFVRHVADTRPETQGSYRWLADFLPSS